MFVTRSRQKTSPAAPERVSPGAGLGRARTFRHLRGGGSQYGRPALTYPTQGLNARIEQVAPTLPHPNLRTASAIWTQTICFCECSRARCSQDTNTYASYQMKARTMPKHNERESFRYELLRNRISPSQSQCSEKPLECHLLPGKLPNQPNQLAVIYFQPLVYQELPRSRRVRLSPSLQPHPPPSPACSRHQPQAGRLSSPTSHACSSFVERCSRIVTENANCRAARTMPMQRMEEASELAGNTINSPGLGHPPGTAAMTAYRIGRAYRGLPASALKSCTETALRIRRSSQNCKTPRPIPPHCPVIQQRPSRALLACSNALPAAASLSLTQQQNVQALMACSEILVPHAPTAPRH